MRSEERLLLRLARAFVGRRAGDVEAIPFDEDIEPERFVRVAESHQLSPLVHRLAADGILRGTPERALGPLRLSAFRAATGNALIEREAVRLFARFADAKIPALVYKGFALGERCYGDRALRAQQDVDLMLRTGDVTKASAILENEGYAPEVQLARASPEESRHWCELNFDKPIVAGAKGTFHIELHWRVLPAFTAIAGEGDEIIPRGVDTSIDGHPFKTFHPVDHLLALALHGAKHQWRELRLILDVALLAASLGPQDVGLLHRRAREWRVQRFLGLALALAERLGGPAISERRMDREAMRVEREFLWGGARSWSSSFFLLRRVDTWFDAARFLHGFARSEWDRRRHGSS